MIRARTLAVLGVAALGCGRMPEDPAIRDGRRVLEAYDSAMNVHGASRVSAVARLKSLTVSDPLADRARDACALMFASLATATELETRLEPMAARLDALAHRDAAVPTAERLEVLQLYALATRAADATAAQIAPCTHAMDALRVATTSRP